MATSFSLTKYLIKYIPAVRSVFFTILLFQLTSCRDRITIENFDSEIWKKDRKGCQNLRADLLEYFKKGKDQLIGKPEAAILQVLGRPDFQELASRNQKYYYYFYQEGLQCSDDKQKFTEGTVQIRINSVGYANEIQFN